MSSPVATVICAWPAISVPWSQVSDRRSCAGSPPIASVIAAATAAGVVPVRQVQQQHEPGGPLHQRADRRACRLPMIRSPSQWPGTARSATSAGRSLIITMPAIFPRRSPAAPPRLAQRPPGPQTRRQLPAQRPPALHVHRLVDRLVRHPHLRPARELRRFSHALICSGDHCFSSLRLHPPRSSAFPASFAVFGRRARTSACACAAPPGTGPGRGPFRAHLPAHRRRRPPQPRRDLPVRLPPPPAPPRSPPAPPATGTARSPAPARSPSPRPPPRTTAPPPAAHPSRPPASRGDSPARTPSQNRTRTGLGTGGRPLDTTTTSHIRKPLSLS